MAVCVHLYGKSPGDHALDGEYNLAWHVKELESTRKAVEVQSNTKPRCYEMTPYMHTLRSKDDIMALDVDLEDKTHKLKGQDREVLEGLIDEPGLNDYEIDF